jgi:YbbR domain-containing protein
VRVGLDLVGRHIELVQQQDVLVNVYLGTPPVKNVYQGVRIEVRGTEDRYRLSRDRLDIQLEGPPDQLGRLTPEDLLLVLDASHLEPGTHDAELKLELPEGMSVRNIELPRVQITIYPPGKKVIKKPAGDEPEPTQ